MTFATLDPENALLAGIVGVVLSGLIVLLRHAHVRWRTRRLRAFWRPFMGKPLTVVVTEYASDGEDPAIAKIARVAGGRWLISQGMALALAEIRDFANRCLNVPGGIAVKGDRSGTVDTQNYIVIGSEASNRQADAAMQLVRESYTIPYRVRWNDELELVQIEFDDGTVLRPTSGGQVGYDYALIVKATVGRMNPRTIVLASGCHMWGSQAAGEALTSEAILQEVVKQAVGDENIAFIIRTQVVNGKSSRPELEFEEGHSTVVPLRPLHHD